jgi:hypothetical protein
MVDGHKEAVTMKKHSRCGKIGRAQALTLPELDQSKAAVLNSLGSMQSRRSYRHAMDDHSQDNDAAPSGC